MTQIFRRTAVPASPNKIGKVLMTSMMVLREYERFLARLDSLKTP